MKFNEFNYVGKKIQLYPNDTYSKFGIIKNVDDLGWIIEITECEERSGYKVGELIFISHSKDFIFSYVK